MVEVVRLVWMGGRVGKVGASEERTRQDFSEDGIYGSFCGGEDSPFGTRC
jgi:hypothetical protein